MTFTFFWFAVHGLDLMVSYGNISAFQQDGGKTEEEKAKSTPM